ncbi:flagellar brake protein [Spartinivicinus poritis]|uniref:Flagellar brake protein n=1 Tax=Spartinivicinus poritis TaxID=2994640 RepID=A0ABT5U3X4_9GAMM|nr:flagellar brake protein [Spartinivicinus sp. A2-2]MDE1461060.1 flagellar brake protein [Spartinivicinus sp. A2-2]
MSYLSDDLDIEEKYQLKRTPQEVSGVLMGILKAKVPIKIYFPSRNISYKTFIIGVDLDNQTFALDELSPIDGNPLIKQGEPFSVYTFYEGVKVTFDNVVLEQIKQDEAGIPYYNFKLPSKLWYLQRRKAFRVRLPSHPAVTATLKLTEDYPAVTTQVIDISATGCQVAVASQQLQENLPEVGQVAENFSMPLHNQHELECAVQIRQIHKDEVTGDLLLGLMFLHVTGLQQRYVELYVNQLQRSALVK